MGELESIRIKIVEGNNEPRNQSKINYFSGWRRYIKPGLNLCLLNISANKGKHDFK